MLLPDSTEEPALKRMAVHHQAEPVVADRPTEADIEVAGKQVGKLKELLRACAALLGAAPMELVPDLKDATTALSDAASRAQALANVTLDKSPTIKQGRLF